MKQYTLPSGWYWVRLKEICKTASGGTPARNVSAYWSGSIPWVKIRDIPGDGFIHDTEEKITNEGLINSNAKIFPCGTILFSIFATIGKVGILCIDAATNQAIAGLTAIDESRVDKMYLFYCLRFVGRVLEIEARGMAQNNVNQRMLRELMVPLPPLTEQRRIVARMEALLGRVREARRLRQQARQDTERLWEAVLAEAFPVYSDETSPKWKWVRLGDVAHRDSVLIRPSQFPERVFEYLGMEQVKPHQWDPPETISVAGVDIKSQTVSFRQGHVLYGKLRPYLNKVVVPLHEGVATTEFIPIVTNSDVLLPEYLAAFLRTPSFVAYASRNTTGSRQPRVRLSAFWDAKIPIVELDEQRAIVSHLSKVHERVKSLKAAQDETERELIQLEQAILEKAFRGEL